MAETAEKKKKSFFNLGMFVSVLAALGLFAVLDRFVLQHAMNKLENLVIGEETEKK